MSENLNMVSYSSDNPADFENYFSKVSMEQKNLLLKEFRAYFEEMGCILDCRQSYTDMYGIDFVITGIQGVHAGVNLGVTIVPNTYSKEEKLISQERFSSSVQDKKVVTRGLYIESSVKNLETGAKTVLNGAVTNFLFCNMFKKDLFAGVRVFEDNSYYYFELDENIRSLRKACHNRTFNDDVLMKGKVTAYFPDKGFGFIEMDSSNESVVPDKFFFHITDVVEEFAENLREYNKEEELEVSFYFGGSSGKKYPKAVEVGDADFVEELDPLDDEEEDY